MMRRRCVTDDDRNTIAEHLEYEWRQLNDMASWIKEISEQHRNEKLRRGVWSGAIESFAVHVKSLIEFLFFSRKNNYARAVDFFEEPEDWSERIESWPDLIVANEMANTQISHLTYTRIDVTPKEKEWHVGAIVRDLQCVFQQLYRAAVEKDRRILRQALEQCGFNETTRTTETTAGDHTLNAPHAKPQFSTTAATTSDATPNRSYVNLHGKTGD